MPRARTSGQEKLVPIGIPSDLVRPRVDGVRILHAPSAKPHASAPWGRSQPCSAECANLFIPSCCRAIVVTRRCQTAAASSMLMSEHRVPSYAPPGPRGHRLVALSSDVFYQLIRTGSHWRKKPLYWLALASKEFEKSHGLASLLVNGRLEASRILFCSLGRPVAGLQSSRHFVPRL